MAFKISMFVLIAAITLVKDAATFTYGPVPVTNQDRSMVGYINNCPSIGSEREKFDVRVLGAEHPRIGGCAWLQSRSRWSIPAFEMWLGRGDSDCCGNCSSLTLDMDRFVMQCLSREPADENSIFKGWWNMTLYNQNAHWTNFPPDYNCAFYQIANEEPMVIQMLISGSRSCDGLSQKLIYSNETIPSGTRYYPDGSMALLFSSEPLEGIHTKRSLTKYMKSVKSGGRP